MSDYKRYPKFRKRRGVGAIIGGVILVAILLTTVLLYFVTVLNNDQRRASYDIESAQESQDKSLEKLVAANTGLFTNATGKYMNTVMKNDGSLSLIVSYSALYCIDCASPNDPTLNSNTVTLNAKETATRLTGPVVTTKTYRVDFITERGNIFYTQDCLVGVSEITCNEGAASGTPDFALSSSPSTVFIAPGDSETSTISVTSLSGFSSAVSLSYSGAPAGMTLALAPTSVPGGSGSSVLTITTLSSIAEGNYVVTITGASGILSHKTEVTIVIFSASGGEEVPTSDDEILKPQIQGIFPNPHGSLGSSSSKQGLWGVVVANPSDAAMSIRRVVVTAFNPYGTNPAIFPNSCPVTNVLPSAGGSWSCPSQNTLIWSGTVSIPAHSAQAFLATAGKPASNDDFPSYSINFNVFTTFGQYAKAGYSGSMSKTASEIANVYLSTTKDSAATSTMIGVRTVASGAPMQLTASIANFGDTGVIKAGTKLIITIPKAFTAVSVSPNPPSAAFNSCTTINLGDGSTQITCALVSDLASGIAKSVQFTMNAPINSSGSSKLYPVLVLADGTDGKAAPMGAVGPVAENVIIVQSS